MKNVLFVVLLILFTSVTGQQLDGWNISATNSINYTGIAISNGRIGILPSKIPFKIDHIILNNVFEKESALGVSRILKGINFANISVEINGEKIEEASVSNWKQTLNMKEASFTTSFDFRDIATITHTIYALRNVPYSGYIDVNVVGKKKCDLKITGIIKTPSVYQNPISTYRVIRDLDTSIPILQTVAQSEFGRHTVGATASFIFHEDTSSEENRQYPKLVHNKISEYDNRLSFEKTLQKGTSFSFTWTGAECSTQDFSDPISESERFVIFNALTPKSILLGKHKELWGKLWEGDIIIEGDVQSQQDVRLALYHLYAFGRGDSNLSIPPMGLSSQGYNGHIFWDAELWMFPPLLALNQDIAKSLLNYRSDRIEIAKRKAANFGYKGAMFPWESDDTGEESTPPRALTGVFEHHITADVAIAFWNYYAVTKDKEWLIKRGYPLLKEVADYWVSRATQNLDGTFSIKNVIGANEFAHNVNDNAFTNGSAITALKYAILAAEEIGFGIKEDWKQVGDNILIHKTKNGITMEHSTYDGEMIKQADVNLLAYPLNIITDKKTILKDLKYYEPKLIKEGPAMGKSVFAIIYARLGDVDNAFRLFRNSYEPNKRPPFGALSESATSNNPYFATGAGGMLQVVLFGFGGLYFDRTGITQKKSILPDHWKSLTIKGVGPDKKTYVVKK
ncbi:glycoside hydrolase family 65 protein [Aquimarina sediminis]|uniref:glycoside hydrolase family 65 protein n=1 Tax=Aquimarina sediminis TaxID=2070536 RepID=UPI000CA0061B|nr:glycoside hydrolase family 65 protein [Aquimarina sediminis]